MSDKKDLTPEEQVQKIQEACGELEWCIALNDSEDQVSGLIIGSLDFVKKVVEQLDDFEEYQVWGRPDGPLH